MKAKAEGRMARKHRRERGELSELGSSSQAVSSGAVTALVPSSFISIPRGAGSFFSC